MAEPQRFQVGDTCYTGIEAAVQAHIARIAPAVIQRDLDTGEGVEAVLMTPRAYNSPTQSDPLEGVWIDYTFEGMTSYETVVEVMRWNPSACELDNVFQGHVNDMSEAWVLFFGAIIVVFCLRKLYDVFDRSPHGDQS